MQVLAKDLESNDHVTHLNLELSLIKFQGIKVGSLVIMGSGFRCDTAKRLTRTLPVPDSSDFFDPQHLLVVFSIQGDTI